MKPCATMNNRQNLGTESGALKLTGYDTSVWSCQCAGDSNRKDAIRKWRINE